MTSEYTAGCRGGVFYVCLRPCIPVLHDAGSLPESQRMSVISSKLGVMYLWGLGLNPETLNIGPLA